MEEYLQTLLLQIRCKKARPFIEEEIRAIEAVEPTKVVGLSINLKNADLDLCPEFFESKYNLPAEDVYNNGADKLLDAIYEYLGE